MTVHEARAATVQQPIRHGAHINHKPELIAGVKLCHIHVVGSIFFFRKHAARLSSHVNVFDSVVVKHVGRAVDRDADFREIGEDEFF